MDVAPTNVEKLRALPWRITANAANTVFVQFTFFGSAFILFLSELGLNKTQIGFQLSLFPFFGLIALVIAPAVARFGYKRTFLTFWGLRNVATAFLLLTPLVVVRLGPQGALTFVTVIVAVFALCRAIAETGWYPWAQEILPDSLRGKFAATNQIFTTLVGLLAVSAAGFVVEQGQGLSRFTLLIGAGVLCGLFSVWAYSFIPGGAPQTAPPAGARGRRDLGDALGDREFITYLAGFGLITLATIPLASFVPLFMQEQIGLSGGQIILLQNGTLIGGLLSSYLWGWAADRYGSKPVLQAGLFVNLFLPVMWLLMPRQSVWSLAVALVIAFLQGVGAAGWTIGSGRLLYVRIVPPEKKSDYMALYYACIGVMGGLSQLVGGRLLDLSRSIDGRAGFLIFDAYTPLFLLGLVATLLGLLAMQRVRADSTVGVAEFAGLFLSGNPFQAMGSMIRYHQARDEHTAVLMTERLSQSRSRLTVDELLEALGDPRFQVRFEAIISIAHMKPDPRLTTALVGLLNGTEIALSVIAAWALGRMGDPAAVEPLREALDSQFRSLQLHSVRALGALNDTTLTPMLQERLAQEENAGLRMAYAAALGQLQAAEATEALLALLAEVGNEGARLELTLSLARIVGREHAFMRLYRHSREDLDTSVAQAVLGLQKRWRRLTAADVALRQALVDCADAWGRGERNAGAALLSQAIGLLPGDYLTGAGETIAVACAAQLEAEGATRPEYVLLALHVLASVPRPARRR